MLTGRYRVTFRRTAELFGLATLVVGAFFLGTTIDPWTGRKRVDWWDVSTVGPTAYDASKGFPRPGETCPPNRQWPEPKAVAARQATIRQTAAAIQAECRAAADGDWDRWELQTAPYRSALKTRVVALKPRPDAAYSPGYEVLEGRDGFPLVEVDSRLGTAHLVDPAILDSFRKSRTVVAADRWLRRRGTELIFVPVPKMTEVYIEHFIDAPADGIVAPQTRHALLELLEANVEAIDCFTRFRELRQPCPDYLYNAADTHWAPRGMRIMAREIADRVARYSFGTAARFALPIVRCVPGPYSFKELRAQKEGFGYSLLSAKQREQVEHVQTTNQAEARLLDGRPVRDDPASPVLLIGNSYVWEFREQLVKELNLLVRTSYNESQTTDAFADFLREPHALDGVRVVVWITTSEQLAHFKAMPPPVLEALAD
jgi:SGNH hydrolase-like domain, acetyltransferase AlgX